MSAMLPPRLCSAWRKFRERWGASSARPKMQKWRSTSFVARRRRLRCAASKQLYSGLCRPFAFEYVAAGVGRFDPKGARAVRQVAEADIWILRDRNAARHCQHQLVTLEDPQIPYEKCRDVKQCDLVALQARIVRMTDHDLRFAQAARGAVTRSDELPKTHLPEIGAGLIGILRSRRRTAARSLHEGRHNVELPVAQLGYRVHVGIGIDAHARRDHRYLGADLEGGGDGCRVLINHEGDRPDGTRIVRWEC